MAGIPQEKIIEAHGSFHTAHCVGCQKEYPHEWIRGKDRFHTSVLTGFDTIVLNKAANKMMLINE